MERSDNVRKVEAMFTEKELITIYPQAIKKFCDLTGVDPVLYHISGDGTDYLHKDMETAEAFLKAGVILQTSNALSASGKTRGDHKDYIGCLTHWHRVIPVSYKKMLKTAREYGLELALDELVDEMVEAAEGWEEELKSYDPRTEEQKKLDALDDMKKRIKALERKEAREARKAEKAEEEDWELEAEEHYRREKEQEEIDALIAQQDETWTDEDDIDKYAEYIDCDAGRPSAPRR